MDLINSLDDDLKTIDSLSSEEIHKRGLLHRAIHILVINNRDEVFVRRRSLKKKLYPGVWSTSVGAHVLKGQISEECAKVNLKKFLDLNLPLEKIGETRVKDEIENEYIIIFLCKSDLVKKLNPEESDEGKFMNVQEIIDLVSRGQTTPHLAKAINFIDNISQKSHNLPIKFLEKLLSFQSRLYQLYLRFYFYL